MRALVWISEGSWRAGVDAARDLLPADAEVTILHVAASDVEELAEHPGPGRLGRRHRPPPGPGPTVRQIGESEARSLLESARERFGRPAQTVARRGRVAREVLEAAADADLLVLVRDGERRRGPKSLGPKTRFVVDHAGCAVLLAWPEPPPGLDAMHWPPHLR
jgi:nucleotide-binding universal stress UspA family protein